MPSSARSTATMSGSHLERDHLARGDALDEPRGQRAEPGADLDDPVLVGRHRRVGDRAQRALGDQEVLAELLLRAQAVLVEQDPRVGKRPEQVARAAFRVLVGHAPRQRRVRRRIEIEAGAFAARRAGSSPRRRSSRRCRCSARAAGRRRGSRPRRRPRASPRAAPSSRRRRRRPARVRARARAPRDASCARAPRRSPPGSSRTDRRAPGRRARRARARDGAARS